jgi:tripartite ATP-independent transporter DctP family solute receptor
MKTKRLIALALVLITLFSLTACGGSSSSGSSGSSSGSSASTSTGSGDSSADAADTAPKYTVNICCDASAETVTGTIVNDFKKMVEEGTNGNVTVNTYLDGAMGSDKEVMENVVTGQIEFLVTTTANMTTDVPALYVFDMPRVFESSEIARAAFDDPDFRTLLESKYEDAGIKLLMLSDQGYRETSSNVALKNPEDFSGVDIRTMTNDLHIEFWKALGANPTPMNRGEVFLALQQGLLDAQEDPYVSIDAWGYSEVQDYICATDHVFHNIVLVTNLSFFEGLPQEYQDVITSACDEILVTSRQMADEVAEPALQNMISEGMEYVEPTQETYDWMTQVAQENVWPLVREKAGDDIVDALVAAAEKARG